MSPRHALSFALVSALILAPALAAAEGGGGPVSLYAYQKILLLLGLIGGAYIVAHFVFGQLTRRFGFVSGVEYVLIGAFVGPVLSLTSYKVLDAETLTYFSLVTEMGTGAIGLLAGMQVNVRNVGFGLEALRQAMIIALITILFVAVGPAVGVYMVWGEVTFGLLAPAFFCVGALALVADSGPLVSLARFHGVEGLKTELASRTARVSSAVAIVGFGFLFCFSNEADTLFLIPRYAFVEWFAIHLVIGVTLGVFFGLYMRRSLGEEELLTVVLGIVILSSGLAYYLQLSPIFVNFLLGLVLNIIGGSASEIRTSLESFERPLYVVLFFFAGANLPFRGVVWWGVALVLLYLPLRLAGRNIGGLLAARFTPKGALEAAGMESLGNDGVPPLGRVLLVPGGLSAAMLLDFHLVFQRYDYEATIYAMMVIAIVISEIIGYSRVRSWLIDATGLDPSSASEVNEMEVA